jgi:hypothetical protein
MPRLLAGKNPHNFRVFELKFDDVKTVGVALGLCVGASVSTGGISDL